MLSFQGGPVPHVQAGRRKAAQSYQEEFRSAQTCLAGFPSIPFHLLNPPSNHMSTQWSLLPELKHKRGFYSLAFGSWLDMNLPCFFLVNLSFVTGEPAVTPRRWMRKEMELLIILTIRALLPSQMVHGGWINTFNDGGRGKLGRLRTG